MASRAGRVIPCLEATEPERPPPHLSSDLLEEIFLRIGSPADLARASAACVSFHRLISDPGFLRRYRSIHPPLLLGLVCKSFEPVEEPHPNAPVARALARAADFTFDYLPRGRCHLWDVRDGRLLLSCSREGVKDSFVFPGLAVCDPLSRRYLLLPPIPDDLVASVHVQECRIRDFEAFFLPYGRGEQEASFRVIGVTECDEKLAVFVFSSATFGWSIGVSTSWDALTLHPDDFILPWPSCYYSYGCFYWKVVGQNKLLRLKTNDMEFAIVVLPLDHNFMKSVIVEAGEGRIGMFYGTSNGNGTSLYYATIQIGGQRTSHWKVENIISLPVGYYSAIITSLEGYIILLSVPKRDGMPSPYFSLEIKTLKIERIGRMIHHYGKVYPYFGFPPSMSPRRV
ncbi:unnamed protein product [Urochloa decumbens]|uniref:F-box domain-containing protein n=1 Tax=Urochloa decumbens TaxID=240449 RepID=A0ABC9FXK3_9POAL